MEDNTRSIPFVYDGLKDSQRKTLMTALVKLKKETKVNVFSGQVITFADYHHGEASLYDTVIKMAQDF